LKISRSRPTKEVNSTNTDKPLEDLTIEVTNTCFLECMHCSSESSLSAEQKLSLETIKAVIDDFKELGGKTIEISGGEPLCYNELSQVITYAKRLGLETHLFSCGVFDISQLETCDDRLEKKVRELKELGLDKVFVSLHGSNEEIHNQMARRNSFKLTSRFIKELVKNDLFVGVHFVPVSINFDNIDDLIQYCLNLNVKQIGLLRFVPQGRGKENEDLLRLSKEQTLELVELLSRELENKDSIVRVGSHLDFCFFFKKDRIPGDCTAGISKCLVASSGDVIPCAVFKGLPEFIAGNIKESRLYQIWKTSPVFKRLRNFNPNQMEGTCARCQFLKRCRARCPAQRYYEWTDLYMGPDWYCPKSPKIVICGSYGDLKRFMEVLGQYKYRYGKRNVFPTQQHLRRSKVCIEAHHGGKGETEETLALRSELMKTYFKKIDRADLTVIVNEKMGKEYYGVGTTIELGYAYAKGKKIRFTKEPMNSNTRSFIGINITQFVGKYRIEH